MIQNDHPDRSPAPLFDLFWENSKLNEATIHPFLRRMEEAPPKEASARMAYPEPPVALPEPDDELYRALERRRSLRSFGDRPLTMEEVGSILCGVKEQAGGKRLVPSAGARYPIEVYALLSNVGGPLGGRVAYYNPDLHALSDVAPCPPMESIETIVRGPFEGRPALILILVAFPERTTRRYGERGGRFVLIEAGHCAQNLHLRMTREGLAGVELGGLYDDPVRACLQLTGTGGRPVLGLACGPVPPGNHPRPPGDL